MHILKFYIHGFILFAIFCNLPYLLNIMLVLFFLVDIVLVYVYVHCSLMYDCLPFISSFSS